MSQRLFARAALVGTNWKVENLDTKESKDYILSRIHRTGYLFVSGAKELWIELSGSTFSRDGSAYLCRSTSGRFKLTEV